MGPAGATGPKGTTGSLSGIDVIGNIVFANSFVSREDYSVFSPIR
jgi:hypothetical protein